MICNYRYDLLSAVQEGVCRTPRITLIDNPLINLTEEKESTESVRAFSCFAQLLGESQVSYEDLLRHDDILNAVLDIGIQQLDKVRNSVSHAGGLVVATDIEHAHQIAALLHSKNQSYVVVTSQTPRAQQLINQYRHDNTCWIVAVSMISEGTDIQRLCICCYLSRIRTDLHYRQVLGRILRKICIEDREAWLFVIAEPVLRNYSQRIANDLPDDQATLHSKKIAMQLTKSRSDNSNKVFRDTFERTKNQPYSKDNIIGRLLQVEESRVLALSFSEHYRKHLLSLT